MFCVFKNYLQMAKGILFTARESRRVVFQVSSPPVASVSSTPSVLSSSPPPPTWNTRHTSHDIFSFLCVLSEFETWGIPNKKQYVHVKTASHNNKTNIIKPVILILSSDWMRHTLNSCLASKLMLCLINLNMFFLVLTCLSLLCHITSCLVYLLWYGTKIFSQSTHIRVGVCRTSSVSYSETLICQVRIPPVNPSAVICWRLWFGQLCNLMLRLN